MTDRLCPVCDRVMRHHQDLLDFTLCEDEEECPEGHYYRSFFYGHTEIQVGGRSWTWSSAYEWETNPWMEIQPAINKLRHDALTAS